MNLFNKKYKRYLLPILFFILGIVSLNGVVIYKQHYVDPINTGKSFLFASLLGFLLYFYEDYTEYTKNKDTIPQDKDNKATYNNNKINFLEKYCSKIIVFFAFLNILVYRYLELNSLILTILVILTILICLKKDYFTLLNKYKD